MDQHEQSAFENHPRRLSAEEMDNPFLVLMEFFSHNRLTECREELRNWLYAALADTSIAESANPANLFFFMNVSKS